MNVCNICGLPKDLCVCEQMNTENKKIFVMERRVKGSKFVTEINGVDNPKEMEELFKELKEKLACGGTVKKGTVELQGKHAKKLVPLLEKKGYAVDSH